MNECFFGAFERSILEKLSEYRKSLNQNDSAKLRIGQYVWAKPNNSSIYWPAKIIQINEITATLECFSPTRTEFKVRSIIFCEAVILTIKVTSANITVNTGKLCLDWLGLRCRLL